MEIPFKQILRDIQLRQLSTFCTLETFKTKEHKDLLPSKHRGLYWLWTNLDYNELKSIPTKKDTQEVPISKLVSQRENLQHLCNVIEPNGFYIVYNGIGGYKTKPTFGLRARINQELNCNHSLTGTLNLLNRHNDGRHDNNWGISFFDFDNDLNKHILSPLPDKKNHYNNYASTLEVLWRIEFGTPLLTRH